MVLTSSVDRRRADHGDQLGLPGGVGAEGDRGADPTPASRSERASLEAATVAGSEAKLPASALL